MNIHIVAGGPTERMPKLHDWQGEDVIWVGVDRGVTYLLEHNIFPAKAFGDFDSITSEELQNIKTQLPHAEIYPSEKDETDTELAVNWALEQNPALIRIFGGTGGRLDHFLGNIQLVLKGLERTTLIEIHDIQNKLFACKEGTYSIKKDVFLPFISFMPITPDVKGITLTGFKYPLEKKHIRFGDTLCISNELEVEIGTFSFDEGILMVIRSRDYHPLS
ncbi:thiamine diphosphokinase [Bacillus sp. CHD6a]|uniref:thiamine diphosphokinase n=1 Tax=Bacillus sp. CHD6a TaxID=1643452 RepID=UPI0006CC2B69|nr:thiamine diphosphokinase [Bacillus sp. CHD6a]KPB04321.1 thiamine pyrophosphokinase [Bacillus sp. CHD6a]